MTADEQQTARDLVALDDAAVDPTGTLTLYLGKALNEIERLTANRKTLLDDLVHCRKLIAGARAVLVDGGTWGHESLIDAAQRVAADNTKLRRTLEQPHLVWAAGQHSVGIDPEAEDRRIRPVYLAARKWHTAPHVLDANHAAGDCDDCPARAAEIELSIAIAEATKESASG